MSGMPANANVNFRKVISHPEMTRPDGKTSKGYETAISYRSSATGTATAVEGYGFDYPYEIVTGQWRFQLWYSDQKLVDEIYEVVQP
jgi:hypothetical protein